MYNVHDFIGKDSGIDLSQPASLTVSQQHWAVQLQVQLKMERYSAEGMLKKIKHIVQIMHIVVFAFSAVGKHKRNLMQDDE